MSVPEKQQVISKCCLVATATLGIFAVFGQWIFDAFGFTIPAFEIAGGILLFAVAFEMMHGERPRTKMTESERTESLEREDVGVIPLGIPLLAGPGAITTVMIYMTHPVPDPVDKMFIFAGILVAVLTTFFLLHYADRIFKRIGRTGTKVVGRIMGLLLAAIAVQFIINGIIGAYANALSNGLLH
jgi:multiple antibiotic resistance protein